MYFFIIGIVLTVIGAFMNIRGNTSKFNPPSGGMSRIPPEAQVKLNQDIQKISGTKGNETYDQYVKKSNVFSANTIGLIILFVGIVFMVLGYFLNI